MVGNLPYLGRRRDLAGDRAHHAGRGIGTQWVGGGPGLLVVRSGALWYLASPTAAPERITGDYLPTGFVTTAALTGALSTRSPREHAQARRPDRNRNKG
jgi:hypothetical protein